MADTAVVELSDEWAIYGDSLRDFSTDVVGAVRMSLPLQMVARTDPGLVRSFNEDALFVDALLGLAILADGMGGYNAGEVASGMAVMRLADDLGRLIGLDPSVAPEQIGGASQVERHLVNEVGAANFAVFNASRTVPQFSGMGTTLVLAWFYDNRMSVAHVGDSRLYRLRGEVFEQLTRDHSLLQEQLDLGMLTAEQARHALHKNLVTRALGVEPTVDVEVNTYDVRPGDIVLLCSDGLSDMVDDADLLLTLQTLGGNLPLAADHLVELANDNGGRDNVSVILVKVEGDFAVPRGWWQQLLARLK